MTLIHISLFCPDCIEAAIASKIIGQRGPVRSVASAIRRRANGWVDPDRPLVMLFLGSSGVGKTELAKQITKYLQRDPSLTMTDIERDGAFIRLDMSEYQHSYTVSNLTGSAKGYVVSSSLIVFFAYSGVHL